MDSSSLENEKYSNIIFDFVNDLNTTFPEYSYLWSKWDSKESIKNDQKDLFEYMMSVFPERFFDILYQNEDIFKDATINTNFLPNVDFKYLYNCPGVSENTKKAIWKYLQLILINILGSIKNKTSFGETMNMFDGINENDLQTKLEETIQGIESFFSNFTNPTEEVPSNEEEESNEKTQEKSNEESNEQSEYSFSKEDIPNPEDLHEHLKGLFDGKIGKLAKELAEEITQDINGLFDEGDDITNIKSTNDVIKALMKNPKKMMDLIKKVGGKLSKKMDSGELSHDDILKEASTLFSHMKDMGGVGGKNDLGELFKNMAKQMGKTGGSGSKVDMNAFSNKMKAQTFKEKMKERFEKKKAAEMAALAAAAAEMSTPDKVPSMSKENSPLDDGYIYKNDNNFVFSTKEKQKKSIIPSSVENVESDDSKIIPIVEEKKTTTSNNKKKNNKKK